MSNADPSYEELRARLANAEMLLTALRRGEVDAVLSQSSVLLLSVQEAEAGLRASEARYRALFEHSLDAILLIGTNGDIIMANPAASRLFGYSAEELTCLREEALIDQTDRRTVYALAARAEAGHFQGEMKYLRRDKNTFIGETSSAVFEDGEKRTTVIIRDITERIRAQQRLRVSEEKFRRYFELGLIGRAMTSLTKGILDVNDELCRMLGYDRKELLQKTWAEITHPDDLAADVAQFNRVIAGEIDGYTLDKRWLRNDGQVVDTIMSAKRLREADGSDYLVVLVQDITARKRTEEELRKIQQELTRVTRITTMGEVAASIAHEINQPLGAIVNNSNAALRLANAPGGSRDTLLETLSDVVNDATRASAIIARIRALATQTIPERTSLQLRDVANEALAFAQLELVEHRIVVHSAFAEDLPTISGDRVQIQQVFLNVIMNAIEAMSDVEAARRILTISGELSRLNASPAVLITVHDLGVGFKGEARQRLFEAFYTTKPNSLGMGLRMGRSIAEAHGGRLWAQANEDMGAKFFLCLPAESSEKL